MPLLRDTKTAYNTDPAHLAVNLVRLPVDVKVFDNSNILYSETKFGYDEYGNPLYNAPSVIGHDNANFGAGGSSIRGDLTTVSRWLNTNSSWLKSTMSYDIAGNLIGVAGR